MDRTRSTYGVLKLRNIKRSGRESLAHLCPEVRDYLELTNEAFIRTISELQEKIEDGSLRLEYDRKHPEQYEPGNASERKIRRLYREWLALPDV